MPRELIDLSYSKSQKLDLFLVDRPDRPVVLCVHGGGFISGSKEDERCRQAAAVLNDAGINCALMNYALATADDRFARWPQNLLDVAEAIAWLHDRAGEFGYDFSRLGLLGFSAGCCLSNLYIQGGKALFEHLDVSTPLYPVRALVGFYGPYDFTIRQPERRSKDEEVNRLHSPAHWLRQSDGSASPPVLHIQGDRDDIVFPDQHAAFEADCRARGIDFTPLIASGFGHSFAPRDTNEDGEAVDFGPQISGFFSRRLAA